MPTTIPVRPTGEAMLKHVHAVAVTGQSDGRVVAARSVPKILSAGEPRQKVTNHFAAFGPQEPEQKSALR